MWPPVAVDDTPVYPAAPPLSTNVMPDGPAANAPTWGTNLRAANPRVCERLETCAPEPVDGWCEACRGFDRGPQA